MWWRKSVRGWVNSDTLSQNSRSSLPGWHIESGGPHKASVGLLDKTLSLKYTHTQTHSQPPPKQMGVLTENIWTYWAWKIADEIPEITTHKLCWVLLKRVEKRYHKLWSDGINLDKHQTMCHSVKVFRGMEFTVFKKRASFTLCIKQCNSQQQCWNYE